MAEERLLHSPEQAAELLEIPRTAVFGLIRSGQLASVKVGRLRRVPTAALHDYVARLSEASRAGLAA